jgi:hypothetical protein
MTFEEYFTEQEIPRISSGIGLWKGVEVVIDNDWDAAENTLCEKVTPFVEENRSRVKGYMVARSERLQKLTLNLFK